MTKGIWSNRFGKPCTYREGLHKYLENNIIGYRRSKLGDYIKGFAKFMGKDKKDSVELVQGNFGKWIEFLKTKNLSWLKKPK